MEKRNIAYLRVSTEDQSYARQFNDDLSKFDLVFEDKLSGKDTNRVELQKCLVELQEGDTLHIWEVSRMARNLDDLRKIVLSLIKRGVSVKFHKEGLEFYAGETTGMRYEMAKLQLSLMGIFAEFERGAINERVREGVRVAMNKGTRFGAANQKYKAKRDKSYDTNIRSKYLYVEKMLSGLRNNNKTLKECAELLNISGIKTPTGNDWTSTNTQRACVYLGIM